MIPARSLRRWFVGVAFLCCSAAQAESEQQCLGVGRFAEDAANLMHLGQSEEHVIATMLDPAKNDSKRSNARQKMLDERDIAVVNWVYTVRPSAADARAHVYAKCMVGGLGSLDMAKYRGAGKTALCAPHGRQPDIRE